MNYVEGLNLLGVKAKEIPCVRGAGIPSATTVGAVGVLYMDTNTGDIYKCTGVSGGFYTWEVLEGTSIVSINIEEV